MIDPPDISSAIYETILADAFVQTNLPVYLGALTVFTRRPVLPDAPYPMIVVEPDIVDTDVGGLNFKQLRIIKDINVYGNNETSSQYRVVEQLAYEIFNLFHRNRFSIEIPSWFTARVWCQGPHAVPSDDDMRVGRVISVSTELVQLL